ncbi:CopG family transcriptional regulator [Rhodoplanes sp. SY1]|uniref:CopG family transcriptional regulator n=1 Tax=Rhodoplanes sp. SY1 TaxID=3166646 RepID=UPI0038B551AA
MKTRMNVYFEAELLQKVADLAARRNLSKSLVVEAAVASFLSPDAEDRREAAFARRLDRISRQIERLTRDVAISSEAVGLFVRFWLIATPPIPDAAWTAAKATGTERYQAFLDALGRRVAKGHSFIHEVSIEVEGQGATPTPEIPADM